MTTSKPELPENLRRWLAEEVCTVSTRQARELTPEETTLIIEFLQSDQPLPWPCPYCGNPSAPPTLDTDACPLCYEYAERAGILLDALEPGEDHSLEMP